MSVDLNVHERLTKLQKDVEEIKEELEDQWHERKDFYIKRVEKVLSKHKNIAIVYLEIDGVRSINEIEKCLIDKQMKIPHTTLWRATQKLLKEGLIKKVGIKDNSFVYAKKPWAKALDLDNYVKTKILQWK
jgi:predicted transcriptional regulator